MSFCCIDEVRKCFYGDRRKNFQILKDSGTQWCTTLKCNNVMDKQSFFFLHWNLNLASDNICLLRSSIFLRYVFNFSKLRVQCSPSVSVKLVCSPVTKMWVLACIFSDNIVNVIDLCENNLLCLIVSGALTDFRIFFDFPDFIKLPLVIFWFIPWTLTIALFRKIKHPSDTITRHSTDRKEYLKLINVARAAI